MIIIITGTINFDEINKIYDVIQVHIHDEFQSIDQYKFLNDIALMKVILFCIHLITIVITLI
jgi:hypothetical protein